MPKRGDEKPIRVSFQVKKAEWPDLHQWLSSFMWGEKSFKIRDVLGRAALDAARHGGHLKISIPLSSMPTPEHPILTQSQNRNADDADVSVESASNGSMPGIGGMDDIVSSWADAFK